jgi:hypothetical protein
MLREKIQKSSAFVVYWKKSSEAAPPQEDKVYLVAINGQAAFAAFRQDGNGLWSFNKDGVSHWAEMPEVPKDAVSSEDRVQVEMES